MPVAICLSSLTTSERFYHCYYHHYLSYLVQHALKTALKTARECLDV